jgi:hypothetical protein
LVKEIMQKFNITQFNEDFKEIEKTEGIIGSPVLFKKYGKFFNTIKDFYFEYAQLLIDSADEQMAKELSEASQM